MLQICTYGLLNSAELLKLLTKCVLISVPRKASVVVLAIDWGGKGMAPKGANLNLPDEELRHDCRWC